jgi:methionine-rich copper-binding protein CopC
MRAAGTERRPARGRGAATALVGGLVALAVLLLAAAPASAHTRLLSSTPADGSTVPTAPDQVTLLFAQHLLGLGAVAVLGPDGANVAVGAPVLDGAAVTQRLASHRPAGVYRLSYRIVSADGHPVSGGVTFTAAGDVGSGSAPAMAVTPSGTAPRPAAGSGGGSSTALAVGLVVGVGALVVVSGAVIAFRARRGQRSTDGA